MRSNDLSNLRRAKRLRDRCRDAAVAAGLRIGLPVSPVQANVAFDAMVDLIREHDRQGAEHEAQIAERESDDSGEMWTDDLGPMDDRPKPADPPCWRCGGSPGHGAVDGCAGYAAGDPDFPGTAPKPTGVERG